MILTRLLSVDSGVHPAAGILERGSAGHLMTLQGANKTLGEPERLPVRAGMRHYQGVASVPAVWQWHREVFCWADAEQMAAEHMRHLGFADVRVTGRGADSGLDVTAQGAAAQVKFHAAPTGSPDVQRLLGAAHAFGWRLFYATAFTPAAEDVAQRVGMGLFMYDTHPVVVAPANEHATVLAPPAPVILERTAWGVLTLASRRQRVLGWVGQVEAATDTPVSNRDRKAMRQLQGRVDAMRLVQAALELLQISDSPRLKASRQERAVRDAEDALRRAAKFVGVRLR